MKIYTVIDDGETIGVYADELKALRAFRKVMEKHQECANWGFMDEEEIQ